MDKIKLVLDVFKKYLFWLLFVVTVVVVLVCWWLSTASLAKSFQQQKSKVEKKFTDVKAISDDAQHPTPEYIRAIKNEDENGKLKDCKLKDLKEGVLSVWKTLYDEQNKNNVWPNVLGKQFLDTITAIDQKDPNGAIPADRVDASHVQAGPAAQRRVVRARKVFTPGHLAVDGRSQIRRQYDQLRSEVNQTQLPYVSSYKPVRSHRVKF